MTPNENNPQTVPAPDPPPQPPQPAAAPDPAPAPAPENPPEAQPPQPEPAADSDTMPVASSGPKFGSFTLTVAIAAVLFVLVAAGAVYAYQHPKKKAVAAVSTQSQHSASMPESPDPSNCMPASANSLTKPLAETAYRSFVKAVVDQNQTCANDLSSSFFLTQAKQEFGAADGKWITATPQGIRPIWKDLAQLPPTLSDASFTQTDYTRPIVARQTPGGLQAQSSDSSELPHGMKLSYPVDLSKYTGNKTDKWQVSISFLAQNGKVLVDDLVVEPQN